MGAFSFDLTPTLSLKKEREILFFLRTRPRVVDYEKYVEDGPDEKGKVAKPN